MVDKKHPECGCAEPKIATFGFEGAKRPTHCKICKTPNMIDIKNRSARCHVCGKTSTMVLPNNRKIKSCPIHILSGMVPIRKLCETCGKYTRTYNWDGLPATFCKDCASDGMVDVRHAKCRFEKCTRHPSFNFPGNASGVFCEEHQLNGMVNVVGPFCSEPGCVGPHGTSRIASFHFQGQSLKKHGRCKEHKLQGMQYKNVCQYSGCGKSPSYNFCGQKKPVLCLRHKLDSMVNVKHDQCETVGCDKIASYNFHGSKKPRFCLFDKLDGMVLVRASCVADGCTKFRRYGVPGHSASHCAEHKHFLKRALANPSHRCEDGNCLALATHGPINSVSAQFCEKDALEGYIDLVQQICASCSTMDVVSEDRLCASCNPDFRRRRHNATQKTVELGLRARLGVVFDDNFVSSDRMIPEDLRNGQDCTRLRPDLLFENKHNGLFVVVETDEHQHGWNDCVTECVCNVGSDGVVTPSCKCEQTRMFNVTQALQRPTVWIRYNPDGYRVGDAKFGKQDAARLNSLSSWLQWCMSPDVTLGENVCRVVHLFFNDFDPTHATFRPVFVAGVLGN